MNPWVRKRGKLYAYSLEGLRAEVIANKNTTKYAIMLVKVPESSEHIAPRSGSKTLIRVMYKINNKMNPLKSGKDSMLYKINDTTKNPD